MSSDDIVLGVDNKSQMICNYITSHRIERALIKPVFNSEYDSEKVERAEDVIKKADVICSFGMSFGITDNTWKNTIIESMLNKNEQVLIFYDYNMSQKEGLTIDQKMDEIDVFKSTLARKWEMNFSHDVLDRIYIPCGKNIFNIMNAMDLQVQGNLNLRGMTKAR